MIYLDNGATTRMAPEVLEAMLPYLGGEFGNPSAVYSLGARAKKAVNEARRSIAGLVGARQEEIFFTSGGTEADNWALKAAAEGFKARGRHIVTTKVEHHAVLRACGYLEQRGFEVTYVDVDGEGLVRLEALEAALRPDTILVSVMTANNETGVIQPIREIGALTRERGICFHTDGVQAFGHIPVNVDHLGVDMLSASAHKCGGPKGVGMLYVRRGVGLPSFLQGGGQEDHRRAGTENVPGIVGFGAAARRAADRMEEQAGKERQLREYLIRRIQEEIPHCRLNGHRERRLPGNVNFTFQGLQGEPLLLALDMKDICVSAGAACHAGSLEPSHVLTAMGLSPQEASGALRFTLSGENTREELDQVVECLKESAARLRSMSPEYEAFCTVQSEK